MVPCKVYPKGRPNLQANMAQKLSFLEVFPSNKYQPVCQLVCSFSVVLTLDDLMDPFLRYTHFLLIKKKDFYLCAIHSDVVHKTLG